MAVEVTIKPNQSTFTAEASVEVGGKDRTIEGTITFEKRGGTGSLSVKIKSGTLSFDEDETEAVLNAFRDVGEACYHHLRDRREQWSNEKQKNAAAKGDLFRDGEEEPNEGGVKQGTPKVSVT